MKIVQLVIDFVRGLRGDETVTAVAPGPEVPSRPVRRRPAETISRLPVSRQERRSVQRVKRVKQRAQQGPLSRQETLRSYGVRHTRRTLRNDLSPVLREDVEGWMRLWGVPGLEERLDIRYSGRLTRSLGRCHPAHGLVRLKRSLADGDPALLREVVCHEVAHAAVFAIHRRRVRPHGKEWGALMRAAGYRARATYRLNAAPVRG